MLDHYLHRFTHLHTATSRVHWTEATRFRAPNKPLLLLAVLDQFAQDSATGDLIELTPESGRVVASVRIEGGAAPGGGGNVLRTGVAGAAAGAGAGQR